MHIWSPPLRFGVVRPARRGETSHTGQAQGRGASWAKLKPAEVRLVRGAATPPAPSAGCLHELPLSPKG